jgi:hypothetical protein
MVRTLNQAKSMTEGGDLLFRQSISKHKDIILTNGKHLKFYHFDKNLIYIHSIHLFLRSEVNLILLVMKQPFLLTLLRAFTHAIYQKLGRANRNKYKRRTNKS